jgi:hypothetical protein
MQSPAPASVPAELKARSLAATGKLPLSFEPNLGQVEAGQSDKRTTYLARGSGYGLALTANEAVLSLNGASKNGTSVSSAVHMQLEGAASNPKIIATEPLPGRSNYLYGNDPKRWVRNVPQFARVEYGAVYPGIDLVYYGKQGQLEYDFVVRSGADPRQIRLNVAGAERVSLGADGSLRLKTPVRELRWNQPVVYQEINGRRRPVAGRFELLAGNRVGFALGQYDRSRDLVIDPILAYSTYFGGTGNETNPQIAIDTNSNIYLAGTTSSATMFPVETCGVLPLPPCPVLSGPTDVFVSKLDPAGSFVIYTTYLNGLDLIATPPLGNATGADSSAGLAVDNAGNAYVTGTTNSTDFPTTTNAFQAAPVAPGLQHVFLSKLDPTGATLLYSSYLSGSAADNAYALAADNNGNAYVLGSTQSVVDFPTTSTSFQPAANGATNLLFVSKFNTVATSPIASLAFSSFLGGGSSTTAATPPDGVFGTCPQLPCGGIALDSTGNAYVAVGTLFTNLPRVNSFQIANAGGIDAFVAKIKFDGTALLYTTYLGGATGDDIANAIALDSAGNAYITGSTTSSDFPQVSSLAGLPAGGGQDAFVAKLNNPSTGTVALTFSTYLGGNGKDTGLGIIADSNQNAFVTGSTTSSNFPVPVVKGLPGTPLAANGTDAFLVKLNTTLAFFVSPTAPTPPDVSPLSSSALLGGSGTDRGTSLALNSVGSVFVTGDTNSTNFPIGSTNNVKVLQTLLNTTGAGPNSDAFLANFGPVTDLMLVVAPPAPVAPSTISRVAIGNNAVFTYTVTNLGPDTSTGAQLTIAVPPTSLGVSAAVFTTNSGSCALVGTNEVCTLGTLPVNGTPATITATLAATAITTTTISMGGNVVPGNSAVDPNLSNNGLGASKIVNVDSFLPTISPAQQSQAAGNTFTYTATFKPQSAPTIPVEFPANISLGCTIQSTSAGVAPSGTSCIITPSPVPMIPNASSATATVSITTTRRTSTAALWKAPTIWYAMWLPLSGLALVGAGSSRRRRWASAVALVALLSLVAMLAACGKSTSTTSTGTQIGAYPVVITVTSGTYSAPPLGVTMTVQ